MPEVVAAPPSAPRNLARQLGASPPVLCVAALALALIPAATLLSSWRPSFPRVTWQVVSGLDSLLPVYLAFGTGRLVQRLGWFTLGVTLLLTTGTLVSYAQQGAWQFFGWPLEPCIVWFSAFPLVISWLFLPVRMATGPITRVSDRGSRFQFRMFDLLLITTVAAATLTLARSLGVNLVTWSELRNMLLCTGYTLLPVLLAAGTRRWHFALGLALFLPAFALSVHKNGGAVNQALVVNNLTFLLVIYLPLVALRMHGYKFRPTTSDRGD